jgi:hypothetical protein
MLSADSFMTTANKNNKIGAVEIPPLEQTLAPDAREFLRLPPVGQRCPVTNLSRAALNAWILPSESNGFKPPVKSFCIRQPGAKTGIRLISYQSLREWILAHADATPTATPESEAHSG